MLEPVENFYGYKTWTKQKLENKGGSTVKQELFKALAVVTTGTMLLLTGCTTTHKLTNSAQNSPSTASAAYEVESTSYDGKSKTVTVHVLPNQGGISQRELIDVSNNEGIINYATAKFSTKPVKNVILVTDQPSTTSDLASAATTRYRSVSKSVIVPQSASSPGKKSAYPSSNGTSIALPPPGARLDASITPLAGLNASTSAKTQAVLSVATSKMGTPYIWGHNEDRGQYGFDCSNYTEYVYHHALGYIITTFSTGQFTSVGVPISRSNVQPGDLITFEQGAHVGIYAGNNQVIQCGGGLKKVGYISIAGGTYWGNNISAIKRMY